MNVLYERIMKQNIMNERKHKVSEIWKFKSIIVKNRNEQLNETIVMNE